MISWDHLSRVFWVFELDMCKMDHLLSNMCKMNYYSRKVDVVTCADIIEYLTCIIQEGFETAKIYFKLSSSFPRLRPPQVPVTETPSLKK